MNTTEVNIPLNQLTVSEQNVRNIATDKDADNSLKASLKAHGLLQNLIVHKLGDSLYGVDAGKRRVTQLQELAEEGFYAEDMPVSCLLLEDATTAIEVSLIENQMRADMHIADEIDAYTKLVADGSTASEIAVRFGKAERTVEQRLRLGNVSPVIRESFREGKTTLEVLMAFGMTSDQNLQERIWKGFVENGGYLNAYNVKRMLTEERIQGDSKIGKFVGVEEYERDGGRVTRDLFAKDDASGIWLDEPDRVYRLAEKKLEQAASELADSWHWVDYTIEFGWEELSKYHKVYPELGELTPAEEAERERLNARRDEIEEAFDGDPDDEDNPINDEWNQILDRLNELWRLPRTRQTFTEEQQSYAGVMISVDHDGTFDYDYGLVKPEDMPEGEGKGRSSSGSSYQDREKKVREKAGYSKKLMDEMRIERTKIVRSHLATNYDEAFDLLLFQMARELFGVPRYYSTSLDVNLFAVGNKYYFLDSFERDTLNLTWADHKEDGQAFAKIQKLSAEDKQALFAACVAATLKGQLTIDLEQRTETEAVIGNLGIDFAEAFRPTVENLWGRQSKKQLLTIAEKVLGKKWVEAHKGDKKGDLAEAMEAAFAVGDDMPEHLTAARRKKALEWTPDGFTA